VTVASTSAEVVSVNGRFLSISPPIERTLSEGEAERQRGALLAYLAKVESQPIAILQDGMSNRDRDRLIYGS
jgi:hypothetical protein